VPCMIFVVFLALAATPGPANAGKAGPAHWTLADTTLFPLERSLTHAEDGVALPDGSLLVGDWDYGLIMLSAAGAKRPFGNFAAAGFERRPAPNWGSPNGISFEPDGRHVLVADITTGAIYRADTETEEVTRIYDHPYGVNTAVRDSSGAIWFTQSTENPQGEESEARMFAAVEGLADGAVFRIAPDQIGRTRPVAERVLSGLNFANGIVIDEPRGLIYVAETVANRILALPFELGTGEAGAPYVLSEIITPDNLELDSDGKLWVVSPLSNEVLLVDPDKGQAHAVFSPTPGASRLVVAEFLRRQEAGESLLSLVGPEAYGPMPGLLTGIILSPAGGPVYVSGLGDALVKLDR
jgi:sugar lactone lactonase YvrE